MEWFSISNNLCNILVKYRFMYNKKEYSAVFNLLANVGLAERNQNSQTGHSTFLLPFLFLDKRENDFPEFIQKVLHVTM